MRTSSIRIDRLSESNVGRVVPRDHALRVLDVDDRLEAQRLVVFGNLEPTVVGALAIPDLEASFDVRRRATALHDLAMGSCCGLQRHAEILRAAQRNDRVKTKEIPAVDKRALQANNRALIHIRIAA